MVVIIMMVLKEFIYIIYHFLLEAKNDLEMVVGILLDWCFKNIRAKTPQVEMTFKYYHVGAGFVDIS